MIRAMTLAPLPTRSPTRPNRPTRIPPLENGDRLTRAEFHRRYEAMPENVRAELIEGIVYMSSPVNTRRHGRPHLTLGGWLAYYIAKTPKLDLYADNGTVLLDDENEPQPDLMLSLPTSLGGLADLDADGYLDAAPTLAIEIAASSAAIDLHGKLDSYLRNGVAEYLVWRTDDAAVDFFISREGRFERQEPDADGLLKSGKFPGLWLDPAALVVLDLPRLYAAVDRGTATAEHAAFVGRLAV